MINLFIQGVTVDENALDALLMPAFEVAAKAGAKVGEEAHKQIVDSWSDQPDIKSEDAKSMSGGQMGVSVDVTGDTASSWWDAINFGSVSPATFGPWMSIGPRNSKTIPGNPFAGDGEVSYDGAFNARADSVIEPRDFIGWVIQEKQAQIIQAVVDALT